MVPPGEVTWSRRADGERSEPSTILALPRTVCVTNRAGHVRGHAEVDTGVDERLDEEKDVGGTAPAEAGGDVDELLVRNVELLAQSGEHLAGEGTGVRAPIPSPSPHTVRLAELPGVLGIARTMVWRLSRLAMTPTWRRRRSRARSAFQRPPRSDRRGLRAGSAA